MIMMLGQRDPPETDPTCQQVVTMLVEYVAGELDASTMQALREHFHDCDDCLHFLQTYHTTIRLTRSACYEEVPVAMRDRILHVLRGRTTGP